MTRILINEVLDGVKKRQKVISLDALKEQGYLPDSPEEEITREEKMDLYVALDQLSPDYRKVLILKYFQDRKVKEIAEIMETTEGAVKVLLHRGRNKMKKIFMEEMGYEGSKT